MPGGAFSMDETARAKRETLSTLPVYSRSMPAHDTTPHMDCPECGGKAYDGDAHHLRNQGGKRRHESFDLRRYECRSCGYKFMTVEIFHREVSPNHRDQPEEIRRLHLRDE